MMVRRWLRVGTKNVSQLKWTGRAASVAGGDVCGVWCVQ